MEGEKLWQLLIHRAFEDKTESFSIQIQLKHLWRSNLSL